MKYSKDPRVDAMVRELLGKGAVFVPKGRGRHACLLFPSGLKHPIIREASDWRAGLNWLSQVKKAVAEGAFNANR